MRAYRKRTQHPFCIYLTREEAQSLAIDADIAANTCDPDDIPHLAQVRDKLNTLILNPERTQA